MSPVVRDMHRLRELERIARFVLQAELAALDRISRMQEEVIHEIRYLQESVVARADMVLEKGGEDPAFLSGHDQTWLRWKEERMARLNNRLARLRADHEMQKEKAALAFGKLEAIKGQV